MQLTKGARLGPYEIVAPVGAGGMGEVYRARDTRLGRTVAIKILPLGVSEDPKLRLRFEREAKAISNLNHPNICALYDVGETKGNGEEGVELSSVLRYIVMEYLEGETLEERLKRGPLPLDQVLRYALEIADALDKAHRRQILHRDLKPSNIMITKTGARLFDFGLAKFLRRGSIPAELIIGNASGGETTTRLFSQASTPEKSITAEGSVIGTLEYMAPEQLQGREPDVRTDIFSFGICLYQMLTGRRPFQGKTRAGVIASILEHDPPPISQYRSSSPAALDWLVKTCLAKDPEDRMQTAHDVMLQLKRIAEESRRLTEIGSGIWKGERRQVYWAAAAGAMVMVILIVAVVSVVSLKRSGSRKPAVKRFSISLPSNAPLASGPFEKFAVSPDGNRIAYVGGSEPTHLYLYSLDSLETRMLPATERARGPFFSPDGQWIGFNTADRGLKKVSLEKGTQVTLSEGRNLRGATWGPDDTIVFAEPRFPLRRISATGGRPETLSSFDSQAEIRWPSFLPDGDSILYTVSDFRGDYENAKLAVRSLKTGTTKTILSGATYGRYTSTGHLAFLHAQTIFAVGFDLRTMTVTGSPVPMIADVDSSIGSGLAQFTISSDGTLFFLPRDPAESERELVWVDRSGASVPATDVRHAYDDPKISPDGKQILVTIGARPRSDLWLYDITRSGWMRLTSGGTNVTGVWSPDGKQIAYSSNKDGDFNLFIGPSDGNISARQVTARQSWDFPTSWSPDGKTIAVVEQYRATLADIYAVAPQGPTTPTALLATPFAEHAGVFSPDGRWLAYQSNESGRYEIYVQAYPPNGRKSMVSATGGTNPVWKRDGTALFYRSGPRMMAVPTRLSPNFTAGKPAVLFRGDFDEPFDVTPDGQRFIMVKRPPQSPRTQINVVLGAFDHLK